MKSAHTLFYFILKIIEYNEAARILGVFPMPSISHQVAFRPLIKELVNRGHELIVITTDPIYSKEESPKNLTEIDVHDISYAAWEKYLMIPRGENSDSYSELKVALHVLTDLFEKQIHTEEVQRILNNKNEKFDLILIENLAIHALVFSHLYKCPVIQISSVGPTYLSFSIIGAPNDPLLYPDFTRKRLYNLTMWEKITEWYDHFWCQYTLQSHEKVIHKMLRRNFGDDVPSLRELFDNVHMLFLNVHPIWQGNSPVPPSVIYMGGLHQRPEKPLPKDLKDYLDSSINGVIYMSFGTNTKPSSLPAEKIQAFVNVFSRLPYEVLWKWDKDVLPGQATNIRIGKWFPQADLLTFNQIPTAPEDIPKTAIVTSFGLFEFKYMTFGLRNAAQTFQRYMDLTLRHPKIKLFITQGGLQSTDEAITAGVPLLGIPMMADQWYNVEKYVHHKIGLQLDLESLTEENFKKAIDEIIGDKSFRENVVRLRTLMHDQPETPLQRAVWWTEHVLRHGGAAHLRAPAANMHWTRYYEIELVVTLLGVLIAFFSASVLILYLLYSFVRKHFSAKVKVKNQ